MHANISAPALKKRQNKIVSADEAVALIHDGDMLCNAGFVGCGVPDELLSALERRFLDTGAPRDLGLIFAAGQGDGGDRGLNHLAHEGLIKKVIGGHWGLIPKMGALALSGKIDAWNLPQGCISQLYRDIAAGKPGTISKVGIGTFVDPRLEGGRIGGTSEEEPVEVMNIAGEDYLFYKAMPINVAFIRATTADIHGNLSMEREALTLDALAMAMAVRNSGGIVIAQVERIAEAGSLDPRQVKVPGVLVDCVVQSRPENHAQTYGTQYNPVFSGELRMPMDDLDSLALDARKVIARRAAMELPSNGVVNLGIGMPEGVAAIAAEERVLDEVTLTAEPGIIGGVPASGLDFGAAVNPDAIIDQNTQFDFYDGGGLDLAVLGMAEVDRTGNVNVSRFGNRLAGAGGFINISQNAKKVVFVGTFTAGGLDMRAEDGHLRIVKEGKTKKFVHAVGQVTFSGQVANDRATPVYYVTERCVFRLTTEGLDLVEIAPGIDVERDILAQMDFHPMIERPGLMDPAIFTDTLMDLRSRMGDMTLDERITWDAEQQVLFVNFENLSVQTSADITDIFNTVVARCKMVGQKVRVVVNYDGFRINGMLLDKYADMVRVLMDSWYVDVRRYTTSAFMRMKLGSELGARGVSPHIFETRELAMAE